MTQPEAANGGLRDQLQTFMDGWVAAKNEPRKQNPVDGVLADLRDTLCDRVDLAKTIDPRSSTGAQYFADVPFIAWLDARVTTTAQAGVYPVYLFCADGSGVYVSLSQGITSWRENRGGTEARRLMKERTTAVRAMLHDDLTDFDLDSPVVLHGKSVLSRDHEASVIAHRFYGIDAVPEDDTIAKDLQQLLDAADRWAASRPRAWIFQANPKRYRLRESLEDRLSVSSPWSWSVSAYARQIAVGDRVFLWEAGPQRGIYAVARVTEPVAVGGNIPPDDPYSADPELRKDHPRCILAIEQVLTDRPLLEQALSTAGLGGLSILKAPQGTNFRVSDEQRQTLDELIGNQHMEQQPIDEDLAPPTAANLSKWLASQGLRYPPELVAPYLTALQTKGFVILSGISGTGKTKLAQRIAELIGPDDETTVAFLPVRPDWRDAKPILGYFNPLSEQFEATDVLRLLLRAHADESASAVTAEGGAGPAQSAVVGRPAYFILLDEMNLARVEYYFADFLSVLESGRDSPAAGGATQAALRLHDRTGGTTSVPDAARGDPIPPELRIPPNVYVTGTINIDETTHAVSPKVLDRAFTLEVLAGPLGNYAADAPIAIDRVRLRAAFQQEGDFLAGSEQGVSSLEADAPFYTEWLQRLADALDPYDLHFAHRTYREILAFTANAQIAPWFDGFGDDSTQAFDAACLSKVLPKLSGGRQRVDEPLRHTLAWAQNPDDPDYDRVSTDLQAPDWEPRDPKLPRTARKARRMWRQATRTGFASFA